MDERNLGYLARDWGVFWLLVGAFAWMNGWL